MPPTIVLDTSVLYSTLLRDVLLRSAEQRLFDARWSQLIIDELRRNLVRDAKLTERRTDRLIADMTGAFPFALVNDFEHLIPTMTNHPKDRHVVAAAVHVQASTIITSNLKHFHPADLDPHGILAISPDDFLSQQLPTASTILVTIIREMVKDYNNPPVSAHGLLTSLGRSVPTFARFMEIQMRDEES